MRAMSMKNIYVGAAFVAALATLGVAQSRMQMAAQSGGAKQAPRFEVDPMWPKPLPNHWVLGSTIGVDVDSNDHIWIIHRGQPTMNPKEIYATANPPASECCVPAPPVLEFDQAGNLVHSWGGPGQGFEWPESNHGITVSSKGEVWIGGNGANDGQVLKFTTDGKFIKQFGFAICRMPAATIPRRSVRSPRSSSTSRTTRPTSRTDTATSGSLCIDMETGKVKRYLGRLRQQAGRHQHRPLQPERAGRAAVPQPGPLRRAVKGPTCSTCATGQQSNPGLHEGRQVRQGSDRREEHARRRRRVGHRLLEGRAAKVPVPERRRQQKIYIFDRASMEILTWFGDGGRQPGQFYAVHSMAVDSKGNMYTTETYEGKRLQKFVYKGLGPITEAEPGHRLADYAVGHISRQDSRLRASGTSRSPEP